MFLKIKDLPVSQFMTAYPISVESNASFKIAVDLINAYQNNLGFHMCLIGGKSSNYDFRYRRTTLSGLV